MTTTPTATAELEYYDDCAKPRANDDDQIEVKIPSGIIKTLKRMDKILKENKEIKSVAIADTLEYDDLDTAEFIVGHSQLLYYGGDYITLELSSKHCADTAEYSIALATS